MVFQDTGKTNSRENQIMSKMYRLTQEVQVGKARLWLMELGVSTAWRVSGKKPLKMLRNEVSRSGDP